MTQVHIEAEIKVRDLEGRLLLAMTAAERGHDVLVGKVSSLLKSSSARPGIYHTKSLTPSRKKLSFHNDLCKGGVVITSQDEEHGLIQSDYRAFAEFRYSQNSLEDASAIACWGPFDKAALDEIYPTRDSSFIETGSPRVDLWRPEFVPYFASDDQRPKTMPDHPYVLISSNLGSILRQKRDWEVIQQRRQLEGTDSDDEFRYYTRVAYKTRLVGHFVKAIHRLSATYPELTIVVRPHPVEAEGAWEGILRPARNVLVSREGPIGPWIRNATAVIHNSCTSSFEAATAGVPVITWSPEPDPAFEKEIPNSIGTKASDLGELTNAVRKVLDEGDSDRVRRKNRKVLESRFTALEGPLASDRIVDMWDRLDTDASTNPGRPSYRRLEARERLRRVTARVGVGGNGDGAAKFPPLDQKEINIMTRSMKSTLNRFDGVEAKVVSSRIVRVRPRR